MDPHQWPVAVWQGGPKTGWLQHLGPDMAHTSNIWSLFRSGVILTRLRKCAFLGGCNTFMYCGKCNACKSLQASKVITTSDIHILRSAKTALCLHRKTKFVVSVKNPQCTMQQRVTGIQQQNSYQPCAQHKKKINYITYCNLSKHSPCCTSHVSTSHTQCVLTQLLNYTAPDSVNNTTQRQVMPMPPTSQLLYWLIPVL